jgi:hypothetical protein
MITFMTSSLRIDEDLQRTANSIGPLLSPTLQWKVWIDETERRPLPKPSNIYVQIFKGPMINKYDGLNKVASTVDTGYLVNLESGDTLYPGAVDCIKLIQAEDYKTSVALMCSVYDEAKVHAIEPDINCVAEHELIPLFGLLMPIEMFRKLAGFNVGYRVLADYDIICRAKFSLGASFTAVKNYPLISRRASGSTEKNSLESRIEHALIQLRTTDIDRKRIMGQLGLLLTRNALDL